MQMTPIKITVTAQIADDLLCEIINLTDMLNYVTGEYEEATARINTEFRTKMEPLGGDLAKAEKTLLALMKKQKQMIFSGGDILKLPHGALIRALEDKVKIPREALAKCEELGFAEVIKIAKSLDREAVEKWTDEKLFLIGAERKPVETFSYDVKKDAT